MDYKPVDAQQLVGPTLLKYGKQGEVATVATKFALKDKVVGVLFVKRNSKSQEFVDKLERVYRTLQANFELFEVVHVEAEESDDDDAKENIDEKIWLGALPEKKKSIIEELNITEYPTLTVIMPDGEVAMSNAIKAVCRDPTGRFFPWKDSVPNFCNTPMWPWLALAVATYVIWKLPRSFLS